MPENRDYKFRRIGIRLINEPGHVVMYGHKAEVYDVETGDFIPVIKADIHLAADSLVTATLTVEVAEVDLGEPGEAQS